MATHYTLALASPADAPHIATIYSKSWVSSFTRLQYNHVSPSTLASSIAPRIEKQMTSPHTKWLVMRYSGFEGVEEVAAVANWTIPHDGENPTIESLEDEDERAKFEDEVTRNSLPESCNKDLVMEFTIGLRKLRKDVLRGRRCYALDNIATHPAHRGKGLASQLIAWGTSLADTEEVLVYLDTSSENPAKGLYTKLGFEEQSDRSTIEDLRKFGGQGSHTHIAFLRYPRNGVEKC